MNKFETALLQTLSSIDESLKALAGRKPKPATPAAQKSAGTPAAKKASKKVAKAANGALPKVVAAKVSKAAAEKGKG